MVKSLQREAEKAKIEYKMGLIERSEAVKRIAPYAEAFDLKSKEIAKKYNQRPKLFSLSGYLR